MSLTSVSVSTGLRLCSLSRAGLRERLGPRKLKIRFRGRFVINGRKSALVIHLACNNAGNCCWLGSSLAPACNTRLSGDEILLGVVVLLSPDVVLLPAAPLDSTVLPQYPDSHP